MTIQPLDFLYLSLGIGFIVLVFYIVFLIKRIHKTLDNVDILLSHFKDTTEEFENIKNKAKGTFYSIASMVLGMMFKNRRR